MASFTSPAQAPLPLFDAVVIGAGQAGLAAAYYLQQAKQQFVVLDERPAVGAVWATRYDSLRLFSPAWASALPGLPWPGKARRYPTKDEAAEYLRLYAHHFQLPVHTNQQVVAVTSANPGFGVHTADGKQYHTRRLIVCTGPYGTPWVPDFSQQLPAVVQQLHSSAYRRPAQLAGSGPVAVVGSGNSALQIAADLAATNREVYVAFDDATPAMPNNSAMWVLLLGSRLLQASRTSPVGRLMRSQPEPVVSADIQRLRRLPTAHFIGRAQSATPAGQLQGVRSTTPVLEGVVWATGFRPNYSWLQVPHAIGSDGQPRQERGLSPVPGLAFLGLPWLRSRRSALMGGAAADARYVVTKLLTTT